jgi:hypothetical protein
LLSFLAPRSVLEPTNSIQGIPRIISQKKRGWGVKLATHFQLLPRLIIIIVEPYLQSPKSPS